ncbi:MAG: tetratricopeptide repeat protein, partial [Proteobacteria bacterium]|nr:tetratricopeptide repeat protein [Pseudomonadota bacterium]
MPGTSSTGGSAETRLRSLLQDGWSRLNIGDLKSAGRICQEILTIKPDLVQGHFLVGLVALEAKDRQTAFQAFGSVTKLDPTHTAAWAQLAKLFMSEGQVTRADAALTEAAKHDPADPLVQDLLGTVYSLMGDYGLARQWYEQACRK